LINEQKKIQTKLDGSRVSLKCEMRCEARLRILIISSLEEKRTRNRKVDIPIFITKIPLLLYINYLLVNAIDSSFNYLSDSLSIISCLYSCDNENQLLSENGA
jgi:hypothetical protein